MDKVAIKNFSVWARSKLIADITYKAGLLGINEKEIKNPLQHSTSEVQFFDIGTKDPYSITGNEIKQRNQLIEKINDKAEQSDYMTAYKSVVEEVAYTWFNRLIAVRFMEVNDYLPSRVRVLSSESPSKLEPDLVTNPFDTDLEFSTGDRELVMKLADENKHDELFRLLFIKQCNALNGILPSLFEETDDYSELLLNVSYTDKDSVIYRLVHDIDEASFDTCEGRGGQVEIIGWLYQYYIEERKNEVINIYKGTVKKDDIPAATQLFTTDWVVKYMVDNSLGRYWIERNPDSNLQEKLEYFITPKNGQIQYLAEKVIPEEMTFFDPCMGSGHILVYAFDVLIEIYRECGYSDRDAAQAIVEKNLYGLDIDNRAGQLVYFAVMMKARSYDRRFLTRGIEPNTYSFTETISIDTMNLEGVTNDNEMNNIGEYLINTFRHSREIGSLLSVEKYDYELFANYLNECATESESTMEGSYWFDYVFLSMQKVIKLAKLMSNQYTVVCTNPPYMNKLEGELKSFVTKNFKSYSGDLFATFIYKNFDYCKPNGYSAFMTPFVWMFIKTYQPLREYIIEHKSITTLVQMEYSAFEEATVPICSFVLKNGIETEKGLCIKLSDFKGNMEVQRQKVIEAISDKECGYFYEINVTVFSGIPGSPIAYWVSQGIQKVFEENQKLGEIAYPRVGLQTGENDRFTRLWFEVNRSTLNIGANDCDSATESNAKWFPYNKGGHFRKWYGNNEYIVNWENNGHEIKNFKDAKGKVRSRPQNLQYYFKESITWSLISSGSIAFRFKPKGFIFDVAGMSCFADPEILLYLLGLNNSVVVKNIIKTLAPTINYQVGDIANIPVYFDEPKSNVIKEIVEENIQISKNDWDMSEVSWNFSKHPLTESVSIQSAFREFEEECSNRFLMLQSNEEKLNKIFIDIYELQDELPHEVADNDVTISKADLQRDIKSFVSYAVGCMFGRYSLDVDGLAFAGGKWDDAKYCSFIPDKDNVIPITDEEYFEDDIVGSLISFVKQVYGVETIEENLDFIAQALGNKGNTSREVIRNYFLKDFYKDHVKTYQKRPIYWLFDSGKANGFKSLVYMHRYDENSIGNLRVDYLHKMQRVYESEISRMQEMVDNGSGREVAQAEKRKEKLLKQLKETKEYDEKIAHLALTRIAIDLDDGVKVNYEKVQTDVDGKKHSILGKI